MRVPVRFGLVLGLLVVAWTFVMGFTGWYKDPGKVALFWLVIPLEIGLVVAALWKTRRESGYGRQVGNGLVVCAVASVLIFAGSLAFTTLAFPEYFQEVEAAGRAMMAAKGVPPDQIEAAVKAQAPMNTPLMNALSGVIGTLATGLVVALLAAIGLRRK